MIRTISEDTIAAISTPPGAGGIGIVRLSGPDAISIASGLFVSSTGRDIQHDAGPVFHGRLIDGDAVLDETLLHVMRAPHSYTRQDVVELNCHGGGALLSAVLEAVLRHGARLAEPGEFTFRAYMSGRIDLTQAEAVIDRIQAGTRAALIAASASAEGGLRRAVDELRDALRSIKAQIEAAVDFVEQDLPELITDALRAEMAAARERTAQLLATADAGRLYREGASIAIVGRPNVGKSSLFNALLRENRAIVTEHAGTTRDTLHETIQIEGIPVRIADTAGLRSTQDAVERIGVDVARRAMGASAALVMVVDGSAAHHAGDAEVAAEVAALGLPSVLVRNKCDLGSAWSAPGQNGFAAEVSLSAKTGEGLQDLERTLGTLLRGGERVPPEQVLVTRVHQKESVRRTLEALDRLQGMQDESPEFMAIEIDEALQALGEITGETTPDDVLGDIFGRFCIGK